MKEQHLNRPADVTQEMIDTWEKDRQAWIEADPMVKVYPPEAYYSWRYLEVKLDELGCPPDLQQQISMAAGQRQVGSDNWWGDTIHVIEEYKQGRWELPGDELAKKILQKRYGDKPNPFDIITDLVKFAGPR
jgi:hypothetical protein